jgi:hypothetical protein
VQIGSLEVQILLQSGKSGQDDAGFPVSSLFHRPRQSKSNFPWYGVQQLPSSFSGRAATPHEMKNQGNHRENQQYVDQRTRGMKSNETEKP